MSKKILITGGSGMVSSQLSEILTIKGYEVIHLSRFGGKSTKYKTFTWDLKEQVIEEALNFAEDLVLKIFETSNTALNIIREKKIKSSGSQILVEKSNEHLKNKITSAIRSQQGKI